MSQEKPKESIEGQECPFCAKGHFVLCQTEHKVNPVDEPEITVSGVWVAKCSSCGETVFPPESSDYIDRVVSEQTEQLTPVQIRDIRESLGVDQTEMSEILGLGGRTYHRWEKGSQYPSRSMCYYIRLLGKFPTVFNWLRTHSWHYEKPNVKLSSRQDEITRKFPDLANSPWKRDEIKDAFNPARGLTAVFK